MIKVTLKIEDELMREVEKLAYRENASINDVVARILLSGLKALDREEVQSQRPYRQRTYNMGEPKVDLTKALALAGELEDEAIIEQMKRAEPQSSDSQIRR